jgi:hypothetical protein
MALSLPDIISEIIELSGGETTTAAEITSARRTIWLALEDWAVSGLNTWRTRSLVIALNGEYPTYTLPDDVDDVLEVRAALVSGALDPTAGDWPMLSRIPRDEYNRLSERSVRGRPGRWYLNRKDDGPEISFTPMGVTGAAVEIIYVSRPLPFDRLSETVKGMPGRCIPALIAEAASQMASKRSLTSPARQARLDARANRTADLMRINDRDRTTFRVSI